MEKGFVDNKVKLVVIFIQFPLLNVGKITRG